MRSRLPKLLTFSFAFLLAAAVALSLGSPAKAGSTPTVASVSVPANATYIVGQNLDFTVNYDQPVTVNTSGGTPSITVTVGTSADAATYLSGSGTAALVFRYTVQTGDADANGATVGAVINLNGGTIVQTADGVTVADLTLNSVGATGGILVDGVAPSVSSIARGGVNPTNASSVDYVATFSEGVSGVDTSDFSLTATGTASGSVASVTPVSSSVYTVTVNTVAGNGTLRLDLNNAGTGITDIPGNAISGGFTGGDTYTIDTTAPTVTSVTVPANGTYSTGATLDFTVNFSEAVIVTGTPRIPITVGSATRYASYLSGSGTSALAFRYTVTSGDSDANGIQLAASLDLNGGTLQDAAGNSANLTLNSVGATTGILVDAVAPTVSGVSVPANGSYKTGQNLDFTVNWSRAVIVTGTPRIALTIGSSTVYASYLSGSGSASLVFRYTVQAGDTDTDGIAVGTLGLNGGTIIDGSGNNAVLTLSAVGSTAAVLVDTTAPAVNSVGVPAAGSYKTGQNLDFTVHFSEPVTVTTSGGTPSIAVTIGSTGKSAAYLSGSGTSALVFRYAVQAADTDNDGIIVGTLSLNGGTLQDAAGNAANLALNSVGATTGVLVDTTAPYATVLTVPANGSYTAAQTLTFDVTFNENVTVTGAPRIPITVGTQTKYAVYTSGSGTAKLSFVYTVASGDSAGNGIKLAASIDLNSGTIVDVATNAANLSLGTLPNTSGILIAGATTPGTSPGSGGSSPGSPDKTPPIKPATVKASAKNGKLFVTFSKATDNTGVTGYEIIIGGKVVQTVRSTSFLLPTASIMPAKTKMLVIEVEAVDAAGNKSEPFTVTLTRLATPKGTPPVVPAWAHRLASWQAEPARKRGKRPQTPKRLPAWYYKWVKWQKNPITVTVG